MRVALLAPPPPPPGHAAPEGGMGTSLQPGAGSGMPAGGVRERRRRAELGLLHIMPGGWI